MIAVLQDQYGCYCLCWFTMVRVLPSSAYYRRFDGRKRPKGVLFPGQALEFCANSSARQLLRNLEDCKQAAKARACATERLRCMYSPGTHDSQPAALSTISYVLCHQLAQQRKVTVRSCAIVGIKTFHTEYALRSSYALTVQHLLYCRTP